MPKPKTRGNGQGTAIKRGKTWEARVVVGWKPNKDGTKLFPIQKTKGGFKTKREALEYCPYLKQAVERPKLSPTVEHYWNAYQSDLENLSESKQTAYKIAWARMESIKDRRIDSISVTELRDLVRDKAKTYYPARDMKVVLSHIYKLAGADQWVDKSIPEYISLPTLEESEREPFTKKEQEALWRTYEKGNKDAGIPLIMIYTGMMTGEMRRLETSMVDIEKREINGVGMKTKVRKNATIHLASSILPVLQDAMAGKDGLIWDCTETAFYNRYYAALEQAGCRKLTPYSCRHTTATALAIDENIAPQTVKKIMRWSTTKMLDRYAHPDTKDLTDAIESIGSKSE